MHKLIAFSVALAAAAVLTGCRKSGAEAASPAATTAAAGSTAAAPAAGAPGQAAPDGQQAAQPGAPVKPVPAELPNVVARVNGEDVTRANFDLLVKNVELGSGPIPAERRDEFLRASLDRLITYTLLQQEAKKRHVEPTDAEVEARLGEMQKQFPDQAAFQKALDARGMSLDRLKADTRTDIAISKMMDAEVASVPEASDAEAQEFYDKNPDKFQQSEQVRASHILLMVDEKADAAAKEKVKAEAEALLKRARSGEDFAALAKEHSQDGSASQGGDLGYFPRGQMVPAFEQAAFALQAGQISDVVTTPFGYHIIKVTDHKPASTVPLAQVAPQVKQYLTAQKKQQQADTFISTLRAKSTIEVLI